jgi:hypothetical protein
MASADVIQPTAEKYEQMESLLCNTSGNVALSERFRILFTLKNIADDRSVEIIGKGKSSYKLYCLYEWLLIVFTLQL